jgi:hypothetical protein
MQPERTMAEARDDRDQLDLGTIGLAMYFVALIVIVLLLLLLPAIF